MTRFFRKYSRFFVLIFMSVLLVIFLIGDAVGRRQRGQQDAAMNVEIGKAFGGPVRYRDIQRADSEMQIATAFGFQLPVRGKTDLERNIAGYLLMEEASRMGVRVSGAEVHAQLDSMPGSGEVFDRVCKRFQASPDAINAALERVLAVPSLMSIMFETALQQSTPRLEEAYRMRYQQAEGLISTIDARAFLSQVPEPTEDEIKAHFEQAKDRAEAHTEEALVYGYRVPDRVRIEYLTIDPKEFIPLISAREKELKAYYEQNKSKYIKPVEGPIADPANPPPPIQMSFDESKEKVKEDFRKDKASEQAQSLINRIREEAFAPWTAMAPDKDGKRPAPATQANLSFSDLAARHSKDVHVTYTSTELVDLSKLRMEAGFAQAKVVENRLTVMATMLAFHVEGLPKQAQVGEREPLRMLEPSPVLIAPAVAAGPQTGPARAYVFRVVEVSPSGPPPLEDVRAAIIRNIKTEKAFAMAGEYARKLGERARSLGLKDAVEDAVELKAALSQAEAAVATQPVDPSNPGKYLAKLEPVAPMRFTSQSVSSVYFNSAKAGGQAIAATTQPAEPSTLKRVVVAPNAKSQAWGVLQADAVKPMYADDFNAQKPNLEQQSFMMARMEFMTSWLMPESIYKRTGFSLNKPNDAAQ
ncbi:MAG: hypothetical protein HZB38_06875 [Planctomycetes bacterium]|nr:hypothetical protein [Planctomycetota bacterium]